MRLDRVQRIAEHHSIFLVGPNGAGKSRTLKAICEHLLQDGQGFSIAVSNTPFARLPPRPRKNYAHIKVGPDTTKKLIARILGDALSSDSYGLISLREVLAYTHYDPVFGIEIALHNQTEGEFHSVDEPTQFLRSRQVTDYYTPRLQDGLSGFPQHSDDAIRLSNSINRYTGKHRIFLGDSSGFLTRFQDIALIVLLQREINEILKPHDLKVSVSFSLVRQGDIEIDIDQASSGELALITTAMFALTHRKKLRNVLVDEPENSLHPQWQIKYFEFLKDLLRRDDVRFFFATHSAVLANSALSSPNSVKIIKCHGDEFSELMFSKDDTDESIEQLLWEAFETVTPASNYLSEKVSEIVWEVQEKRMHPEQAVKLIDAYISSSFSEKQVAFLNSCKELIASLK